MDVAHEGSVLQGFGVVPLILVTVLRHVLLVHGHANISNPDRTSMRLLFNANSTTAAQVMR